MTFSSRYRTIDRLLHRLAFATPAAQAGIADLERRMFRRELDAFDVGPPVLITALPRAGTTILLELLAATPELASHTYRDMPFLLCPMLWQSLAGRFARDDEPQERAHGDGLRIALDSPEAFDEVVWRLFWRRHYERDRIVPWTRCDAPEFTEFYAAHRRKVVALRARTKPTARRYLTKNNLNVARLPALVDAVPDATVLVAVREPLQHAASLLRQHERFTALHRSDAFARRYMAGIGHFDFGANLLPVDFDGWLQECPNRDATALEFWLRYWCATYRHVARHRAHERIHVVAFEALGAARTLDPLAEAVGLDAAALDAQLGRLHPAPRHAVDAGPLPGDLVAQARALYLELSADSVVAPSGSRT